MAGLPWPKSLDVALERSYDLRRNHDLSATSVDTYSRVELFAVE